jgi:hypothetical protein
MGHEVREVSHRFRYRVDGARLQCSMKLSITCEHENSSGTDRCYSGIGQPQPLECRIANKQSARVVGFFDVLNQHFEQLADCGQLVPQ